MRFSKMAVLSASGVAALGVELSIGEHGEVARRGAGQSKAVIRREKRGRPRTSGVLEVQPPDSASSHDSEGSALQQEGNPGGCFQNATVVHCDAQKTTVDDYEVFFQTPKKKGWGDRWEDSSGVVFFFHGTDMEGESEVFGGTSPYGALLGSYTEERAQAIKKFLEKGYAVVSPQAKAHMSSNGVGHIYWEVERWDFLYFRSWTNSDDFALTSKLFDKFKDMELHAIGFSSGAYHIGKVGNNKDLGPKLNTLSLLSGGHLFESSVDVNHPPAQFLYGKGDTYMDESGTKSYKKSLDDSKVETKLVDKECATPALIGAHGTGAHRWIPGAPDLVLEWVKGHSGKRTLKPEPKPKSMCVVM